MKPHEVAFHALKTSDDRLPIEAGCLGIEGLDELIGLLRPLARGHYSNYDVELLAEWRKREEDWFPALFPVTHEGTRRWLEEKIIPDPDGILFMVEDVTRRPVGHVGLSNCAPSDHWPMSCEIGYLLRGDPNAPRGIMTMAYQSLMDWAEESLGIEVFTARVFSHNVKSLNLHYATGFRAVEAVPMYRNLLPEEQRVEWYHVPSYSGAPAERWELLLERKV